MATFAWKQLNLTGKVKLWNFLTFFKKTPNTHSKSRCLSSVVGIQLLTTAAWIAFISLEVLTYGLLRRTHTPKRTRSVKPAQLSVAPPDYYRKKKKTIVNVGPFCGDHPQPLDGALYKQKPPPAPGEDIWATLDGDEKHTHTLYSFVKEICRNSALKYIKTTRPLMSKETKNNTTGT